MEWLKKIVTNENTWKIISAMLFIISIALLFLVDTMQREAAFLCGKYCEASSGSDISAPGGFAYSVGECACRLSQNINNFFPDDFFRSLQQ